MLLIAFLYTVVYIRIEDTYDWKDRADPINRFTNNLNQLSRLV